MANCEPVAHFSDAALQRRLLRIALAVNATMFVVGLVAGLVARSSGLIADSLDMLADASAYTIALLAIGRSDFFKARATRLSGALLLLLGIGVLADVARRGLFGSSPDGVVIIATASVAFVANATVLRLLARIRAEGEHLNAAWIFTKVDVIANLAVVVSGILVLLTRFHVVDLIVGTAIGAYVIKEAVEILLLARKAYNDALAQAPGSL
jgi:Co/Zn/Cd efflux system component